MVNIYCLNRRQSSNRRGQKLLLNDLHSVSEVGYVLVGPDPPRCRDATPEAEWTQAARLCDYGR
jgi:hypothetical protein